MKKFHHYVHGQKFTLVTYHQSLLSNLHPHKGITAMALARLQRCALFLACHKYDIVYRSTKTHGNADALSRLPVESSMSETDINLDDADIFHVRRALASNK